ncbi:uncharacterized protein BX663DRAFT_443466, partial [Cokeromyces recurvatus]|uniref:uncharacterized protein n=1 Tax=Cokeromyces recurvatus TaxID=90255 RepID=UPI00222019F1
TFRQIYQHYLQYSPACLYNCINIKMISKSHSSFGRDRIFWLLMTHIEHDCVLC